jgi:hypothetical protein
MLSGRISTGNTEAAIGLSVFVIGLWVAYEIGGKIATNDFGTLEYATLGFAVLVWR